MTPENSFFNKERAPIQVREELQEDYDAIDEVNEAAFKKGDTAKLVRDIRDSGNMISSLVATEDGKVVGHILFSKLDVQMETGNLEIATLAPLAVSPDHQGRGIGSKLMSQGIETCRQQGYKVIVLLGHPTYYSKFGFSSEVAKHISSPFSGKDSWMALELEEGALEGIQGKVTYPDYFNIKQ